MNQLGNMKDKKIPLFCGKEEGKSKMKLIKFMHKTKKNPKNIADAIGSTHPPIYGWLRGEKSIKYSTWDKINNYIDEYKK